MANWRHHEVDESKKGTEREKHQSGGSETKNGKQGFGSYTHSLFSVRRIGCNDNWCNFLDIIRLIYEGRVNHVLAFYTYPEKLYQLYIVCILELMNNPTNIFSKHYLYPRLINLKTMNNITVINVFFNDTEKNIFMIFLRTFYL